MNLYQISNAYRLIEEQLIDNGGIVTEDLEIALEINEDNKKEAFENIFNLVQEKEDELVAIKSRIEKLTELKKAKEKTIDSCKAALAKGVVFFGPQTIDGVKLSTRKSESTNVDGLNGTLELIDKELSERFEKKLSDLDSNDIEILAESTGLDVELVNKIQWYRAQMYLKEQLNVTLQPDKKLIKTAIKAGDDVMGCYIIQKDNLSIK